MRPKRKAAAEAIQRICSSKRRKLNNNNKNSTHSTDRHELLNGLNDERQDDREAKREASANDETIIDERQDEISTTETAETETDPDFAALDRAFVLGLTLHHAVSKENIRGVKHLLKSGVDPNKVDSSGKTPLHEAIHLRSMSLIQILLDAGADVNHVGDASNPRPIIHEAIKLEPHATKPGRLAITKKLISHGANVKAVDGMGRSALYSAASSPYSTDYNDLLQLLLGHGANPHANPPPGKILSKPFLKVLAEGDLFSVGLFLTYRIKLTRYPRSLHRACHNVNNPEVLEFLLASGLFDVNQLSPTGFFAPLHVAVSCNNPKAVEVLLNWGADVDIIHEPTGSTPLHLVKYPSRGLEIPRESTERCTQLLLDHGANVDAIQRCSGKTALQLALNDFESRMFLGNRSDEVLERMRQRKYMLEIRNAQLSKEQVVERTSRQVGENRAFHIENFFRKSYHEELNVAKTVQVMEGMSILDFLLDKSGRFSKTEMLGKLSKSELVDKMKQFESFIGRINDKLEELSKKELLEEEAIEKLSELTGLEKETFRLILLKIIRKLESRDLQALTYDINHKI